MKGDDCSERSLKNFRVGTSVVQTADLLSLSVGLFIGVMLSGKSRRRKEDGRP